MLLVQVSTTPPHRRPSRSAEKGPLPPPRPPSSTLGPVAAAGDGAALEEAAADGDGVGATGTAAGTRIIPAIAAAVVAMTPATTTTELVAQRMPRGMP